MSQADNRSRAGLNWRDYGGTGETMVMVHGLGGSLINWDAVGPMFARNRRVVAPDLPGFGHSAPRDDYEMSTFVGAVAEFIEEIGPPVVLVGNSMGGMVCEYVASRHPDLVDSLILVSPATPPRLPDDRLHWPTVTRLTLEALPGVGNLFGRLIRSRFTATEIVHLSLDAITHNPARVPPHVVENLIDMAEQRIDYPWAVTSLNKTAFTIAMIYRRPRTFVSMIRRIVAPTLVIHGVADQIVSPTAVEWLCSLRHDWELVQMEDTGHTPQLDAPVRFVGVVESWLNARSA